MKRWMLLVAASAAFAVAGCEEPATQEIETAPPVLDDTTTPAASDAGVPAAGTELPDDVPPADTTALPPEQQPSEATVQPESETLFY